VFLGCCYKQLVPRPQWLTDPRVSDIGNVSACISNRPAGWVDRWDFNAAGFYDTRELAAAALKGAEYSIATLFMYQFYPIRFDAMGGAVAVQIESVFGGGAVSLPTTTLPEPTHFWGFDVVQRWAERRPGHVDDVLALGGGFGCSPLSCNNLSSEFPVNRHCLFNGWNNTVRAARRLAVRQPDQGCYYIFGVHVPKARDLDFGFTAPIDPLLLGPPAEHYAVLDE
jgi:hypothetical protein